MKVSIFLCVLILCSFGKAFGYPIQDAVVGLPNPELVTVYPDEVDKNLYYFLPTTVELVRDADGKPRLGVQYWGFTGADPGGLGAALTFSVRPAFDKIKLQQVADAIKAKNPNARWAAIPVICSRMNVILNSQFFPDNQTINNVQSTPLNNVPPAPLGPVVTIGTPPATPVAPASAPEITPAVATPAVPTSLCTKAGPRSNVAAQGGSVDSTQAFSIAINNIGARAFAIKSSSDMDVLGAEYTYVFRGIGTRLHAKITVRTKRVYEHFKARSSGNAWWGLVKTSWSADWQKLTNDGSIKVEFLQGGSTVSEDYMMEVFKSLVSAKIAGTGMFKPELQPAGISNPGAARMGWGFSGGGGWEKLDETNNFTFEIQKQALEEREFSVGLTFSAVCGKYPNNFADLTTVGNKCISKTKFEQLSKNVEQCVGKKLAVWKSRLDQGLITQTTWERESNLATTAPCYGT